MNITEVRKGDILRFKSYAMRVESNPELKGAVVTLRGRTNQNGCPLVTKKFNVSLLVNVER
jgi:hypothetical protein